MPTFKVRHVGFLQQVAGVQEEEVEMPPAATVGDLLAVLRDRRGEDLAAAVLTRQGRLREAARVLVSNRNVNELQGLDTPLTGTEVSVLFGLWPVAGG